MGPQMDWAKAPRELLELPRLAQAVYTYLDLEAGTKGHCAPSQREIAEAIHASRSRVNEAIRLLANRDGADLISVEREGKGRRYFIHQRGEQAPSRGPQLDLNNTGSREGNMFPEETCSETEHVPLGDTLRGEHVPSGDTFGDRTSFSSRREEEDLQTPGSSSSSSFSDPDPDRDRSDFHKRLGNGPICDEHGERGKPSLDGSGRFYHELDADERQSTGRRHCTFVAERLPVVTADPYAHVYRRV